VSTADNRHYFIVWLWLITLVLVSVTASWFLPKAQALTLIFVVAFAKAFLVARNYMHLKNEKAIYYAIALVPLTFVVIFLLGLFPDFVYHVTKP